MRQRAYTFLVVLLLIFPKANFAQKTNPLWGKNSPSSFKNSPTFQIRDIGYSPEKQAICVNRSFYGIIRETVMCGGEQKAGRIMDLTEYWIDELGYFCKKEILLEKAISVPIRFRLGSLDYVNKMEGKLCY